MRNFCAPHRTDLDRASGSCLTHKELVQIAETLPQPIAKSIMSNKRKLHEELSRLFTETCGVLGDHCWGRFYFPESFRPVKPSSWSVESRLWLNTFDIWLVMRQYEKEHGDFRFVGVFPRNFAEITNSGRCVSAQMCERDIAKGKKKLGFVFNHDTSRQDGSHWVSMFIDLSGSLARGKPSIFYFDSQGRPPKEEVADFAKSFNIDFKWNEVQHQFKNTECGMFAMNFLVSCLESPPGSTFQSIVSTIGDDEMAFSLRSKFFAPRPLAAMKKNLTRKKPN